MPRRNQPRTVGAERHVSERVAYERRERGMTLKELSERMGNVGCPTHISALQLIEKGPDENGVPAREIKVDELVAFAKVFGLDVTDMLEPVTDVVDRKARQALDALIESLDRFGDAGYNLFTSFQLFRRNAAFEGVFERLDDMWDPQRLVDDAYLRPDVPESSNIAQALFLCTYRLMELVKLVPDTSSKRLISDVDWRPDKGRKAE